MVGGIGSGAVDMELEQVRFLELGIPDALYSSVVYGNEIAIRYNNALRSVGCSVEEYRAAENEYRGLLVSILSDAVLLSSYVS